MCQRASFVPNCDCPDCMPFGADGCMDAIDAALHEASQRAPRGVYRVKATAGTLAIDWCAEDGAAPPRIEREALHEAAHALRRHGRDVSLAPGMRALYLAA